MRPALLSLAFAASAALFATSSALNFNTSMLRSELPADSPLLEIKPRLQATAYNPVNAKLFVYFSGVAYCDQSAIMDWYVSIGAS
jgi:hypothetical protein